MTRRRLQGAGVDDPAVVDDTPVADVPAITPERSATTIDEVRHAIATVRSADVLGPRPARSLATLAWDALRRGGSMFTIAEWIASSTPRRPAIVDSAETVTYGELVDRSLRRCESIARIRPAGHRRTRVVLIGRNRSAYVEWMLACGRAGADLVLVNTAMAVEQLDAVCRTRRPDLVLCDIEFDAGARRAGAPVQHIDAPMTGGTGSSTRRWSGARRRRTRATITMLTSGTTGPASLVSQRPSPLALARMSVALIDRLGVRAGQPTLLTVPLLHGHGLATLALTLATGSPLHLVASTHGDDLLDRIDSAQIEVAVVVPTILRRLIDAADAGTSGAKSLRAIVCGSAPLIAATVVRALDTFGPVVFNLYGTSESGLVSLATPADLRAAPGSVGRLLPGVTVRIVDTHGAAVAPGATGRIIVSCAQVPDGFDTGDLGHLDRTGLLFLHGRSDDLIVRGGENMFPLMIEERICAEIDCIAECAVVAHPDDSEFGSTLHLFAVLGPNRTETAASVVDELAERLPRVMRPTVVSIVDELPRNLSGEIVRRRLGAVTGEARVR